jgi:hypothetical protein
MTLNRFISEDPILKPGDPNVPFLLPYLLINPAMLSAYNYVRNDPVGKSDPLGLYESPGGDTPPPDGWVPGVPAPPWSGLTIDPRGASCQALCTFATKLTCWGLAGGAGVGTGGPGAIVWVPCSIATTVVCHKICPPVLCHKK